MSLKTPSNNCKADDTNNRCNIKQYDSAEEPSSTKNVSQHGPAKSSIVGGTSSSDMASSRDNVTKKNQTQNTHQPMKGSNFARPSAQYQYQRNDMSRPIGRNTSRNQNAPRKYSPESQRPPPSYYHRFSNAQGNYIYGSDSQQIFSNPQQYQQNPHLVSGFDGRERSSGDNHFPHSSPPGHHGFSHIPTQEYGQQGEMNSWQNQIPPQQGYQQHQAVPMQPNQQIWNDAPEQMYWQPQCENGNMGWMQQQQLQHYHQQQQQLQQQMNYQNNAAGTFSNYSQNNEQTYGSNSGQYYPTPSSTPSGYSYYSPAQTHSPLHPHMYQLQHQQGPVAPFYGHPFPVNPMCNFSNFNASHHGNAITSASNSPQPNQHEVSQHIDTVIKHTLRRQQERNTPPLSSTSPQNVEPNQKFVATDKQNSVIKQAMASSVPETEKLTEKTEANVTSSVATENISSDEPAPKAIEIKDEDEKKELSFSSLLSYSLVVEIKERVSKVTSSGMVEEQTLARTVEHLEEFTINDGHEPSPVLEGSSGSNQKLDYSACEQENCTKVLSVDENELQLHHVVEEHVASVQIPQENSMETEREKPSTSKPSKSSKRKPIVQPQRTSEKCLVSVLQENNEKKFRVLRKIQNGLRNSKFFPRSTVQTEKKNITNTNPVSNNEEQKATSSTTRRLTKRQKKEQKKKDRIAERHRMDKTATRNVKTAMENNPQNGASNQSVGKVNTMQMVTSVLPYDTTEVTQNENSSIADEQPNDSGLIESNNMQHLEQPSTAELYVDEGQAAANTVQVGCSVEKILHGEMDIFGEDWSSLDSQEVFSSATPSEVSENELGEDIVQGEEGTSSRQEDNLSQKEQQWKSAETEKLNIDINLIIFTEPYTRARSDLKFYVEDIHNMDSISTNTAVKCVLYLQALMLIRRPLMTLKFRNEITPLFECSPVGIGLEIMNCWNEKLIKTWDPETFRKHCETFLCAKIKLYSRSDSLQDQKLNQLYGMILKFFNAAFYEDLYWLIIQNLHGHNGESDLEYLEMFETAVMKVAYNKVSLQFPTVGEVLANAKNKLEEKYINHFIEYLKKEYESRWTPIKAENLKTNEKVTLQMHNDILSDPSLCAPEDTNAFYLQSLDALRGMEKTPTVQLYEKFYMFLQEITSNILDVDVANMKGRLKFNVNSLNHHDYAFLLWFGHGKKQKLQ